MNYKQAKDLFVFCFVCIKMKISELIDRLNLLKKLHGDIPVQAVDTVSFCQKDYDNIHIIRFDSTTNLIVIEA